MNSEAFPAQPPVDHHARLSHPLRLGALERLDLLGSAPNAAFDRATRLATRITGAPTAFVSLVTDTDQHFVSHVGLPASPERAETPLSHSFCQYVVTTDRPLAVSDAREHPLLAENGATRDLGVRAYLGIPVHARDGTVLGSFCAISDEPRDWTEDDAASLADVALGLETEIALREESLSRKLLNRELNHRVKNIFTMITGMIRIGARGADNLQNFSSALSMRITALGQAHQLILPAMDDEPSVGETSLQALVATLVEPHLSGREERFTIDGPPVMLGAKAATNVALVLHELATNAAKYGALWDPDGVLAVTWETSDEALTLDWREEIDDSGAETTEPTAGFGSQLVGMIVRASLGGTMEVETDGGYRYRFQLPLAELT